MVTYHPQWLKVRELIAEGAIGRLRHVQGAFTYFNIDPANMRNKPRARRRRPARHRRLSDRGDPLRHRQGAGAGAGDGRARPNFGTDIYSSIRADFGGFELSFYLLDPDGGAPADGLPRREGLHRGALRRSMPAIYDHANRAAQSGTTRRRSSASPAYASTGCRPRPSPARPGARDVRSSRSRIRSATRN